ncbi:MAG: hypothetical protein JNK98_09850 [Chitinophagaceae bacterium]|nr:hypothetical protein [Chitinophagaceae bacterium]
MKKVSIVQAVSLFAGVFFLSASLLQCTKDGELVKNLDRSYTGGPDSTVYAAFYESNTIATADVVPDVNDVIKMRGVQTIIHEYCNTSNCHGGPIAPRFEIYSQIMQYVKPGDPEGSKLWEYITTNDFDKAMPPVNSSHELGQRDKSIIYNWIKNGAKERPDLNDFRPAAIRLMVDGCSSANCHNTATATGGWARKGLITGLTSADTTQYTYINPLSGSITVYCQLSNQTLMNQVWTAYKDSVKRFYADTAANASFRPWKTVSTPVSALSTRGPLGNYDDIIMDILYPKSVRTNSSVVYTDPVTLKGYYVRGNPLVSTDCFVRRMDSSLIYRNPLTLVETSKNGSMAYDDGGFSPSEVALFKAWYFADPNIPDVWKYGIGNVGIFKYRKTNNYIIKR